MFIKDVTEGLVLMWKGHEFQKLFWFQFYFGHVCMAELCYNYNDMVISGIVLN